jgi:molybdate transport repressor ModE-like protein
MQLFTYMKVEIDLRWKLGMNSALPLDDSVFVLLAGIQETGSLQKACKRAEVSYRHAWGLLASSAEVLGQPLAELSRGRGSQLAPLGSAVLAARLQVESRLAPELARISQELAHQFSSPAPAGGRRWRMFASHDLALLNARESLGRACGVDLDIETHGSDECLDALARRRCNIAGFHMAGDESPEAAIRSSLGRGPDRPIRLIEFVKREQGLMLRPGFEIEISCIADIARKGARFVNRQRGSGTRTLFDRLLKEENLRAGDIRGYQDEEFTHLAVAATIAGGGAEAGFGIRAAAVQFGLPFVPLERETYYLACREERPDGGHISRLATFLKSAEFRAICAGFPGYDTAQSGSDSLLSAARTRQQLRDHMR